MRDEIPMLGHSFAYADGEFITDTAKPLYKYYCSNDGCEESETVPAEVSREIVEPTCDKGGSERIAYYVFIDGDYYESVTEKKIPPIGHSFDNADGVWEWNGTDSATYTVSCSNDPSHSSEYKATLSESVEDSTCFENGRKVYTASVTVGGVTYSDSKEEIIGKKEHSLDYANGVWEWNGTDSATYTVRCSNDYCAHNLSWGSSSDEVFVPADCENAGYTSYTVTVDTDFGSYTDTKTFVTEPTGHDLDLNSGEWVWRDDALRASLVFKCKNSTEHTVSFDASVEYTVTEIPTCQSAGAAVSVARVTVEGEEYVDEMSVYLPIEPHELDLENGYWQWDEYETATLYIPCKLGEHYAVEESVWVDKMVENPTCTTDGYELYTVSLYVDGLTFCDEKYVDLPAIGHDYEISSVEWYCEDTVYATVRVICKNDPRHSGSDMAFASSEITKAPTCTLAGELLYTVEVEIDSQTFTVSTAGVAEKKGHTFSGAVCYDCGIPVYTVGLEFELLEDESGYAVKGKGSFVGSVLSIPNEHNGLPVLEIMAEAFKGNETITELYIPETVLKIGADSFNGCKNLALIDFGDAYTTVEASAFAYCTAIVELDIPAGVYKVKNGAFAGCTSIKRLSIASDSIYDGAFYSLTSLRELDLKEGVREIGNAFSGDSPLFSVTLPSTLKSIGTSPFNSERIVEVKNLSSIEIAPDLSSPYSFYKNLRNVYSDTEGESALFTDPETDFVFLRYNGEFHLMGYVGEGSVSELPESCQGERYSIYKRAFYNTDIENGTLYIPESVYRIYEYAFAYNETLKIVYGAEGVEEIGAYSFYNCSELMSFTLGAKLKNIYTDAFYGCDRLYDLIDHSSLGVGAGTLSYGRVAFKAIKVITDTTVSEPGIFIVDDFAFYLRDNLCYLVGYYGDGDDSVQGQITLPESFGDHYYGIYQRAIRPVDGVTKINLSAGVTSICSNAFSYNVTEVYIPVISNLERIEKKAFIDTEITDIFLTSSLRYIGENAFPETLESAEFADKNGWYTEVIGFVTVKPEYISDPNDAADYLLSNITRYYTKDKK